MVNFENLFDDFILSTYPKAGYPFYDIYRNDHGYSLEIALAGFSKEEIKVETEDGYVFIETEKDTIDEEMTVVTKNIAKRNVKVKYKIPEYHTVDMVVFHDGILKVWMKKDLPDHMKRVTLRIGSD